MRTQPGGGSAKEEQEREGSEEIGKTDHTLAHMHTVMPRVTQRLLESSEAPHSVVTG